MKTILASGVIIILLLAALFLLLLFAAVALSAQPNAKPSVRSDCDILGLDESTAKTSRAPAPTFAPQPFTVAGAIKRSINAALAGQQGQQQQQIGQQQGQIVAVPGRIIFRPSGGFFSRRGK